MLYILSIYILYKNININDGYYYYYEKVNIFLKKTILKSKWVFKIWVRIFLCMFKI